MEKENSTTVALNQCQEQDPANASIRIQSNYREQNFERVKKISEMILTIIERLT